MRSTAFQDTPNLFGGSLFGSADAAGVKPSGAEEESECDPAQDVNEDVDPASIRSKEEDNGQDLQTTDVADEAEAEVEASGAGEEETGGGT
jgi:hypothetical protein